MKERYGVDNFVQSSVFASQKDQIKTKKRNTNLKNNGVDHPLQNEELFNKQRNSCFKKKTFTFPSGNIASVQGYEPQILTELLKHFDEEDIVCGEKLPEIWYDFESKHRRYYPDILSNRAI